MGQAGTISKRAYSLVPTKANIEPIRLLEGETIYIGRGLDNTLVLTSPLVSAQHARLQIGHDAVTVIDLDSHNGVFLNGMKIRTKTAVNGDKLYFADICCELQRLADVVVFETTQPNAPAGGDVE